MARKRQGAAREAGPGGKKKVLGHTIEAGARTALAKALEEARPKW